MNLILFAATILFIYFFMQASSNLSVISFGELFASLDHQIVPFGSGPYLLVSYLEHWYGWIPSPPSLLSRDVFVCLSQHFITFLEKQMLMVQFMLSFGLEIIFSKSSFFMLELLFKCLVILINNSPLLIHFFIIHLFIFE